MFVILPESRAPRARRFGGTAVSLALHAALVAAAVALTTAGPAIANGVTTPPRDTIIYLAPDRGTRPEVPRTGTHRPTSADRTPTHVFTGVPTELPPIDVGAPVVDAADVVLGSEAQALGASSTGIGLPSRGALGAGGGVIGERDVDRAPRLLGNAPPLRYPDVLRGAGITGQVVLEFVVDTVGRAEPGSETVVSATRPEFAEAVRRALPSFRFAPGEVAGHRVRTRVRMPFDIRLAEGSR